MSTMTEELTDQQYDLADRIAEVIDGMKRARNWSPSELGRKLGADTVAVKVVLQWMAARQYIAAQGTGAWTRYSSLRVRTINDDLAG